MQPDNVILNYLKLSSYNLTEFIVLTMTFSCKYIGIRKPEIVEKINSF